MLFQDGDSNEELTKEPALSIFEDVLDPSEVNCDGCDDAADVSTARYRIHLKNLAQFYLISDYLSVGASFRMVSRILAMTKESTSLASLVSVSEGKVDAFARYVCALNLQSLKDLLARVWTFFVAMDMSIHMATSYLNIRIRLHRKSSILNFHLLAIPMFSRHTGEQIFLHAAKALDVLALSWKKLILSISTDGERKMTGSLDIQLDIKLQCFFASLMYEQFYSSLTSLISYLRRQQNLINDMKIKAPTVSNIRWESMGKVAICVSPSVAPSPLWWIVLMFIEKISAEATITFRSLEGLTTIVSKQREGLQRLHDVYIRLFKASQPLSVEDTNAVDHGISVLSEDYRYSLQLSDVTEVLEDLGLFVAGKIEGTNLAVCKVNLIAGVISIVAERDSSNKAAAEMPHVLPHQLVMLRGRELSDILKIQTPRLRTTCSITEIDIIEQEFAQLQSAYHRESSFKAMLDACAFPGTSTVESDFSIVKWEKDVGRASLTDFSLEVILHAKQFNQMRSINVQ
ncbi:hypothetical protein MPTK1_5g00010 [Marchantia polymorpha subsp. ruderalis]